jgi:Protein of unknown function (DUF1800)
LKKIFTEEFKKNNEGSKIKNPLEYILQLEHELKIKLPNDKILVFFLKEQGMDLFNQPNVKGWEGGKSWLTSQIFLQRNNVADLFCSGKTINRKMFKTENESDLTSQNISITPNWKKGTNHEIINQLKERLLINTDETAQKEFETILKYDFDPEAKNANQAILRLINAMIKTPEFQLI